MSAPGDSSDTARSTDAEKAVMIRSEEQLEVHTVRTATERIRIRKVIVTEERTITLALRREEIVMEREPLNTAYPDPTETTAATPAPPLTILLRTEEPVISSRIVPVERVHVLIDTITQMQAVTDEVRTERIEIQHAISGPHPRVTDR